MEAIYVQGGDVSAWRWCVCTKVMSVHGGGVYARVMSVHGGGICARR